MKLNWSLRDQLLRKTGRKKT